MGQEIEALRFNQEAFRQFQQRLHDETQLIGQWIADRHFSNRDFVGGLELELCLVDREGRPTASNEAVIDAVKSKNVVPELSKFNLEFNVEPSALTGDGIERLASGLKATWDETREKAKPLGVSIVAIGILPTLAEEHLTLSNISALHRYHALNEQLLRLRRGRPVRLNISGVDELACEHQGVMLEAGTTSLQLHLQVPQAHAAYAYNLATVLSAPTVAIGANSPLLFGKQLWSETRIPLFEQAVDMEGPVDRVTLGTNYATNDLAFLFEENEKLYPVLLPLDMEQDREKLAHLRLHNGTIWRWNRPIVGFDSDGTPHLRVEHRVMAAGTTIVDMSAQMAFFYGLMMDYLQQERLPIEENLPFHSAWTNFHEAARVGFKANLLWLDGKKWLLKKLILEVLLPAAERGLNSLQVAPSIIDSWLEIIAARVTTGKTGAQWQTDFFVQSGGDTLALVREYRTRQEAGEPVHLWSY